MTDYSGNVFKTVRKSKKMTQKQACEGICELRHYQRIEKNETLASILIMSKISERLGVNIFDYVTYSSDENVYHIKQIFDQAAHHLYRFEFTEAYKILKDSDYLNDSVSPNVIQSRDYLKLMASYCANLDPTITEEDFVDLLKISSSINSLDDIFTLLISEVEYRILNSIASFRYNAGNVQEARQLLVDTVKHMEEEGKVKDFHHIYCKIAQNLGRVELDLKNFESAKRITKSGLNMAIKNSNLFVFEGLCKVHGQALYHLEGAEASRAFLLTYLAILNVVKPNNNYQKITKSLIDEYNLDVEVSY